MREIEEFNYLNNSSKQTQPWGQIFLSIAAIIVTFVGANIEGFDWVLYLTVPMLIGTFLLVTCNTPAAKWFVVKIKQRKDIKLISSVSDEYLEYLDKFKIVKEITDTIQNMNWGDTKKPRYTPPHNRLSDLTTIINGKSHSKFSKAVFLNHLLNLHMDEADSFIQECDYLVVQRKVTYKYDNDKPKLLKLIRKYDSFREEHDAFCSKVNGKTANISLRQFYDHTFSFIPKELAIS